MIEQTHRQRACFGRYDELRQIQVRTTALTPRASNDTGTPGSFKGARATLSALDGAKIETAKRRPLARPDARRVARRADQSPR